MMVEVNEWAETPVVKKNASVIHAMPIGNGRYYTRVDYAYEGDHENTTIRNAEPP